MKTCRAGLHQYEPVPGGRQGCPECREARNKAWRKANPARVAATNAKWATKNLAYLREYAHMRRSKNPELFRERFNSWAARNVEKRRLTNKMWGKVNPDKVRARQARDRARSTAELDDVYVKRLLRHCPNPPQELIEAKRIHLKVTRILKVLTK